MRNKNTSWKPSFNASMDLCNYIERGDCTQKGVESRWRKTFSLVLAYLGPFPRSTRSYLWDELVSGNWKRLHLTDEELSLPPDHWLDKLRWEVFYCSDRWSLDRLTRCHWLYRAYDEACSHYEQENE